MADQTLAACVAEIKASPGKFYVYVLSRPCGTPFYVGCGKVRAKGWQRIVFHETETRRGGTSHKCNVIRLIWSTGEVVRYAVESWHASEAAMFDREIALIANTGRADLGRGPLANWSDGGDGLVNRSEAVNAKARATMLKSVTPEFRKMNSDRLKAMWSTPGGRAKRLAAYADPDARARFIEANRRAIAGEERRRKVSVTSKAKWQDAGYRARHSEAMRVARSAPEHGLKISAITRERWSDPEYRERMREIHRKSWAKRKAGPE